MSSAPKPVVPSLNGWSPSYLDEQYAVYQRDPGAVSPELFAFFRGFDLAQAGDLRLDGQGPASPPASAAGLGGTPASRASSDGSRFSGVAAITPAAGRPAGRTSHFQAVVDDLIGAYRAHGHLVAQIDPLGAPRERPEDLTLAYHQLSDADLDRPVDGSRLGLGDAVPLRDVVEWLERVYCGSIGFEVMHIQDTAQRAWLLERFESINGHLELDRGSKAHLLELLTKSELFERFLGRRYPGEKRFSLEGAESLIPLLDHMLEGASGLGVEEVVVGMAHRGRLNVLNNILGKTYEQIFTEFEEAWAEDFVDGGGDVKYHRGYSGTRRYRTGRMLHLAMASNPSHLEAVNGVVQGRCRAKQRLRGDTDRDRVIPVLMHGDAALAGQGTVQEILNFSQLEGYTTGGTLHVVINNQIGFTTTPSDGRSSRYCTDIGKMLDAPLLHVNAEDPEACVTAAQIAIEYRQQFKRDVFVDLVCYRRYGHNEQDEASFTQPLMAAQIKSKKSILSVYADRLLEGGVIQPADIKAIETRIDETREEQPNDPTSDAGSARWSGMRHEWSFDPGDTAVDEETLAEVCTALGRFPDGFSINSKLKRFFDARAKLPETREISYADAEALAYGTLLIEGHPIRLSGQDSRRGTFSHRHAVVRDTKTAEPYTPLNNIRELGDHGSDNAPGTPGADGRPRQARFCVYDSPLSEAGVLAFDYGYSLGDPSMLVLWEAQFGDFNNGAQVIIDQFVASAETKWDRWSGMVMLLPHGYEGMGPEHSSARMERFLKLCGGNNMQVCYPTTAGQAFHMLRRQLKRDFRKPLIVMTPKSMLRVPTGSIDDLTTGGFQEFMDDPMFADGSENAADRKNVKRVVLVCGKLYWELAERREKLGRTDVALIRVEQVHPFHGERLKELLALYPDSAERCYAQEEPYNQAAYVFVNNKCENELGMDRLRFIGRPSSGSPATGSKKQHKLEQEAILTETIGPLPAEKPKAAGGKLAASA